jgi:hypothetical protein
VVIALVACNDRPLGPGGGASAPDGTQFPSVGPAASSVPAAGPDPACLDDGTCHAAWQSAITTVVPSEFEDNFVAALGRRIYYASASNNSERAPQYLKSWDVDDGRVREEPLQGNPLVAAGYTGSLIGARGQLWYFADKGWSLRPGDDAWRSEPAFPDGELTFAVDGGRIFAVGGRKTLAAFAAFDADAKTWTTGMPAPPLRLYRACAAAIDGRLYVFGGDSDLGAGDPMVMKVFDEAAGQWSVLGDDARFSGVCYGVEATAWRGRIVALETRALRLFDPRAGKWGATISTPLTDDGTLVPVAPDDGNLYLASTRSQGTSVTIWKLALK